jgi:hypothetical protein
MYWSYGIAVEQVGLHGPEAANYESVVKMHLAWIEQSEVGRLLLVGIARNVLNGTRNNLAKFTAPAQPGEPIRGVRIQRYTGGDCNATEGNSTVNYSPWLQGPCGHIWTRISKNRGMLPHEVLFHELVHALRDAAGHGNSMAPLSGGLKGYDNTEELIAVVVTNVYMADPTNKKADRVGLRRDHGFGTLNPALADSLEFFASSQDAYKYIDQFCREDAWFTKKLAESKATFNPIAVYYHDQAAARSKSASASAMIRDFWPRPAS